MSVILGPSSKAPMHCTRTLEAIVQPVLVLPKEYTYGYWGIHIHMSIWPMYCTRTLKTSVQPILVLPERERERERGGEREG